MKAAGSKTAPSTSATSPCPSRRRRGARAHPRRGGVPLRPPPRPRRLGGRAPHREPRPRGHRHRRGARARRRAVRRGGRAGDPRPRRRRAAATGAAPASTASAGGPATARRPRPSSAPSPSIAVWAPALVTLPDEHRRPGSAARVRRPHRLRRGEEASAHGVLPGRTVAVIGAAGGLGHYAVQIPEAFGYGVRRRRHRRGAPRVRPLAGRRTGGRAPTRPRGVRRARRGRRRLVFAARVGGLPARAADAAASGGLFVARRAPPDQRRQPRDQPVPVLPSRTPRSSTPRSAPCRTCASSSTSPPPGKVKTHVSRTGSALGARRRSSTSSKPARTSAAPSSPT